MYLNIFFFTKLIANMLFQNKLQIMFFSSQQTQCRPFQPYNRGKLYHFVQDLKLLIQAPEPSSFLTKETPKFD